MTESQDHEESVKQCIQYVVYLRGSICFRHPTLSVLDQDLREVRAFPDEIVESEGRQTTALRHRGTHVMWSILSRL